MHHRSRRTDKPGNPPQVHMSQRDTNNTQGPQGRGQTPRPRPKPRKKSAATGSSDRRKPAAAANQRPGTARKRPTAGTGRKAPSKARKRISGRTRTLRIVGFAALAVLLGAVVVGSVWYFAIARDLPKPGTQARGRDQSSLITDRNGEEITKLFAEQDRTDRALSDMPVPLRQAVIATEDKRYYEHKGVDPWGIARALWVDITQGKRHGGSTITQQYVVNAFVERESTLTRKVKEAMLAYRVEKQLSKDEILELYLNTIYFGHGAYGVESAAEVYFGAQVEDLTSAQCAMIAGVIKSPGRYSPYLDPEAAKERRDTVLMQMNEQGYLTAEEKKTAQAEEIVLVGLKQASTQAPYFIEYVKAQLAEEYGAEALYRGGIKVKTTIDLRMQRAAEKAVADALDQPDDPSAALVAINPITGEILAMVGGRDFETQQFNVAVQGKRQPGSAFKPFVLASALNQGVLPEQTFPAGPASFALKNGQTWTVTGASGGNAGQMRLREATEKSVNSVFAKLILDTDPKKTVKMAEKLGIHSGVEPVPAIALGGLEHGVSPLEMASAYGTLAAGGKQTVPYGIAEVLDSKDESIFSAETSATQAIDPALAYLTTDILRGVISKGTGTAAKIGRPAAGKTGTTQEYRDAWFVGYTPQLVCAVWVGYPDTQREMKSVHGRRVTGGSFPAEIWAQFMKSALASAPELEFTRPPKGVSVVKVCADSGGAATDYCPTTFSGQFLTQHTPKACTLHATPTKITIPNVVGMTKDAALAALKKLMLLFKVVEEDVPGVAAGLVAKQSPDAASEGTTQTVVTITVSNGGAGNTPPRAEFSINPTQAGVGQSVDFDATASSDDGKIVTYYWEFGDSTEGKGKKTSHAFILPGTYDVTLWVTDDKDQTSSITRAVTVR